MEIQKRGFIHIYFGKGKGKTTAAIGLIIRHLGYGGKVAFLQFDKGHDKEEHYNERKILRTLKNIDLFVTGKERMINGKFRFGNTKEDYEEAVRGLNILKDLIKNNDKNNYGLIVVDELLSAMTYNLIKKEDVLEIINLFKLYKNPFEFILTGRIENGNLNLFTDKVDLITEMKLVKHYYDEGILAREGIEY